MLVKSVELQSLLLLIIKTTRCTKFTNLFLESNSTFFGQILCDVQVTVPRDKFL